MLMVGVGDSGRRSVSWESRPALLMDLGMGVGLPDCGADRCVHAM